jgi:hypothetical protein
MGLSYICEIGLYYFVGNYYMPSPPSSKNTSKTRKRRLGHKGHLHTRHKLKLPKVGGNKDNTKKSPPKLEIEIPIDNDKTGQSVLGITINDNDSPNTTLRRTGEIMTKRIQNRMPNNNPFSTSNKHIIPEEHAMMEDEKSIAERKKKKEKKGTR